MCFFSTIFSFYFLLTTLCVMCLFFILPTFLVAFKTSDDFNWLYFESDNYNLIFFKMVRLKLLKLKMLLNKEAEQDLSTNTFLVILDVCSFIKYSSRNNQFSCKRMKRSKMSYKWQDIVSISFPNRGLNHLQIRVNTSID